MELIVDRIEGDFVIVEYDNGKITELPKDLFENVKEGDIVNLDIDEEETQKRKENIQTLMDDLFID